MTLPRDRFAYATLLDMFEYGEEKQQTEAEEALSRLGPPFAPLLLEWVLSIEPQKPERYVRLFIQLGRDVADYLLPYLGGEQGRAPWYASRVVAALGDSRATPLLLTQLQSDDASHRAWAAASLGEMEAVEAIDPLVLLLDDPDFGVREVAIDSLIALGVLAVPALLQILTTSAASERWQANVCRVLGQRPEPEAVQVLLHYAVDAQAARPVRVAALKGLRGREQPEVRESVWRIAQVATEDQAVREAAIMALHGWSSEHVIQQWAVTLVADETLSPSLRSAALSLLQGPWGAYRTAFAVVAHLVSTPVPSPPQLAPGTLALYVAAIHLLPSLGEARAMPVLLAVLNSSETTLAREALRTLSWHGDLWTLQQLRDAVDTGMARFPQHALVAYDELRSRLAAVRTPGEARRETLVAEWGLLRVYRRERLPVYRDPSQRIVISDNRGTWRRRPPIVLGPREEHCAVYLCRHDLEHLIALVEAEPGNWGQMLRVLTDRVLPGVEERIGVLECAAQEPHKTPEDNLAVRYRLRRVRLHRAYIHRIVQTRLDEQ